MWMCMGADFETFNYPANGNHPQSLSQQMQQFVNNEAAKHCHHQRHPYQMIVYHVFYIHIHVERNYASKQGKPSKRASK